MPVTDLQTCEDKDLFWVSLSAEKVPGVVPDAADECISPSQVAEPIESKLNHDRR